MELLIKGDSVRKEITPNITYEFIEKSEQSLWTFMLFSGYLKHQNEEKTEDGRIFKLKIPNKEVLYVFKISIIKWFEENASNRDMEKMLNQLLKGDVETFTYMFKDLKYETELIKKGIKKENIIKLAIVFDGKEVELRV